MKAQEGASAELIWRLNKDFIEEPLFENTIYYSSNGHNRSIVEVFFLDYEPDILWQDGYIDRADFIHDISHSQIGIRLHNISKTDALQYTMSLNFRHTENSDAVIYVLCK